MNAKIKAVLTSIVTWLTLIQFSLVILADEIGKLFANGEAATVIQVIVYVVAVLASILTLISRLTPVLESQRGLVLPRNAPTTLTLNRPPP